MPAHATITGSNKKYGALPSSMSDAAEEVLEAGAGNISNDMSNDNKKPRPSRHGAAFLDRWLRADRSANFTGDDLAAIYGKREPPHDGQQGGARFGGGLLQQNLGGESNDMSNEKQKPCRSRQGAAFDHWLRADKSVNFTGDDLAAIYSEHKPPDGQGVRFGGLLQNLGGSSTRTSVRRGSVGNTGHRRSSTSEQIEDYLGPTDRTVEELLEERMQRQQQQQQRVAYYSVDRGLPDTPVWHRRKKSLIEMVRRRHSSSSKKRAHEQKSKGAGERKTLLHLQLSTSFDNNKKRGYSYDAKAVHAIETQRHHYDRGVVVIIGVIMACTGYVVSRTADKLLEKKVEHSLDLLLMQMENKGGEGPGSSSSGIHMPTQTAMAFYVGTSTLLALCAFVPVAIRPVSAGSGIAEAKATLNGVVVPDCTALTTALCKALSVVCSVAASLPAGLEGPMIHLGLCIGENANKFLVPGWNGDWPVFDPLRSDRSRIDYAAIGCAAGVAAAFRSPIGGVLFAMEEGSSFWSTALTWRCFLSACVCVVALYFLLGLEQGKFAVTSMALFNGIEEQEAGPHDVPEFQFVEYALFAVVGAVGGLIGALFCTANRALAVLRRTLSLGLYHKALEVGCIAFVTACLTWILPSIASLTSCKSLETVSMPKHHYRSMSCAEGEYNELATLLLNPLGGGGIALLFNEPNPDTFSVQACFISGLLHLTILCVAFGMSVSAGIFIPLLFSGACFGRGFALIVGLDPQTYAIVGAAAVLGGVARVLISLTAIVTHTTSHSHMMTPVMVATLLAQLVGNSVSGRPGIYDVILQLRGIPFLEEMPPAAVRHANIRARNVMQSGGKSGIVTLAIHVQVGELIAILQQHQFSSFPVVDRDGDGALVGRISRVDLLALLSRRDVFYVKKGEESDDEEGELPMDFAELDRARPSYALAISLLPEDIGKDLTEEDKAKFLHLAAYLQVAPHTFDGHGSAERAYEMFRSLGLREIIVVDKKSRPIGIITRHELALLEEIGHEHAAKQKKEEFDMYMSMSNFRQHFE